MLLCFGQIPRVSAGRSGFGWTFVMPLLLSCFFLGKPTEEAVALPLLPLSLFECWLLRPSRHDDFPVSHLNSTLC